MSRYSFQFFDVSTFCSTVWTGWISPILEDYCGNFYSHFDIWNNLEKIFFVDFFKIHRGDPYDYDQNRKGPPL